MSKPFEARKVRQGNPIQTRDGKPARLLAHDIRTGRGYLEMVVAILVKESPECEYVRTYDPDGRWNAAGEDNPDDLVLAPLFRFKDQDFYVGDEILFRHGGNLPWNKIAIQSVDRVNIQKYPYKYALLSELEKKDESLPKKLPTWKTCSQGWDIDL